MSQSKTPAMCADCATIGPRRGRPAIAVGWSGTNGVWRCPEHTAEARRALEARERARLAEGSPTPPYPRALLWPS